MRPRRHFWRRLLGGLVLLAVGAVFAWPYLVQLLGRNSEREPKEMARGLSPEAQQLLAEALGGLDAVRLMDYHVHVAGLGTDGSRAYVNDAMLSWWHPLRRASFDIYANAAGIRDREAADRQFRQRLWALIDSTPSGARFLLLAFDQYHGTDGEPNPSRSSFFMPNETVFRWADEHPERLVAALSVHPYREDAREVLERFGSQGGRVVKWLPNAMGIDPLDARCDPFFATMKRLDLILLSHAGEERAVHAEEDQALGNPLRLRRALDAGVKVIIAHCASLGQDRDLDAHEPREVDSFDLFLRLMDEERYRGLLFGEISAITQFNRLSQPLTTLLARADLHERLVNGSDYPLPAINAVIQTRALVRAGFLLEEERAALNEIFAFHPLLFDLAVKRTVHHPETGQRFAPRVFELHAELVPWR